MVAWLSEMMTMAIPNHATAVGIVGYGLYLPSTYLEARDIAAATEGKWSEQAVREKLGIKRKPMPGREDGTQEMAVYAAKDALQRSQIEPDEIDLILCIGEEYKEYGLTTSGIYIQEQIGARRAWAVDVQQRCNSTIVALKMAKDMLLADEDLQTVLIVGGYRNGDLIDYTDADASFMYNLGAGAGAFIVRKGYTRNRILGTHIVTDGSLSRTVGVRYLGTTHPIESLSHDEAARLRERGNRSLTVLDSEKMKTRLNEVSMSNWMTCVDRALEKSGLQRKDIDFLNVLHFKPSMYHHLLEELGLRRDQSVYLDETGHIGHVDQMIAIDEGLRQGRLRDGAVMVVLAAGIGYVWGASVIHWGECP